MNTAEIITLSLAVLAGVLIGAIFFGGLWWTVLYGLKVKRPALLFILSLTARFALALIGFYLVAGGHLERLVACLVGFIVSRVVIGRLMRCHRTLSDPRSAGALLASQTIPERQDSITPPPPLARTRTATRLSSPKSCPTKPKLYIADHSSRPRKRGTLHDHEAGEVGTTSSRTTASRNAQKG
jgi:F1F0 ATPase subunit 2